MFKFQVTITRVDGYVFRNAFETISEARDFVKLASSVLFPGETIRLETI